MPADRRRSYEELAALVGWQAEQIERLRAEVAELRRRFGAGQSELFEAAGVGLGS